MTALRTITRIQDADDAPTGVDGQFLKWDAVANKYVMSDVVQTGVANTFTTGPQTIQTGNDANKGLIVKANSATQSASIFEVQKSNGTAVFIVSADMSGNPVLTTSISNSNVFLQGDGSQNLVFRQWALINLQSTINFGADLVTWNASIAHYARFTVPSGLGTNLDYLQAYTVGGTASTGGIHLSGSGHTIAFGGVSGSPDTLLWRSAAGVLYTDSSLTRTGLSSTTVREQVTLDSAWVDTTDATRKARFLLKVWDTLAREVMRGEADGSNPLIGFLGAVAVSRQSVGNAATDAATTQTLVNNLRTALINLGLCKI